MLQHLCRASVVVALAMSGCAGTDSNALDPSDDAGQFVEASSVQTTVIDEHDRSEPDDVESADDPVAIDEGDNDETPVSSTEPASSDAIPEGIDLVVPVSMVEWGYELEAITIPVGSTVRFDFVNDGMIEHEAMFGDQHQQQEFADAEDGHGDHGSEGSHHGDVAAITLDPGQAGSLVVTFDQRGEMLIGCHLAGHWEAGMVATLEIV